MFLMDDMRKMTTHALADRRGSQEVCLYFHHQHHAVSWCNKEQIREQCKQFYKLRKKGILTMREDNNGTIELNGEKFHYFVVQHTDEEKDQVDPLAMANGLWVDGFVYYFTRSANRDALYKYIMGIKSV